MDQRSAVLLCRKRVTRAQVREAALISVPLPARVHQQLRKTLGCKPGENLQFQVESNDFRALAHLARHSETILLAPVRAICEELESGALVRLELPEFAGSTMDFDIVHLAQRTLAPAAQRAVTTIEAATRR